MEEKEGVQSKIKKKEKKKGAWGGGGGGKEIEKKIR